MAAVFGMALVGALLIGCSESTPPPDSDGDGVADERDNCPMLANPEQEDDTDCDGVAEDIDNCPMLANPEQGTDTDCDGVAEDIDNCPTAYNPGQEDTDPPDGAGYACDGDVDDNDNGLIEIHFLEDLDFVRHNLAGTSYDDEADDGVDNEGDTTGAPMATTGTACEGVTTTTLCGYELVRDLDFTEDNSYRNPETMVMGSGAMVTIKTAWAASTEMGWTPIGDNSTNADTTRFTAIFDGNGNTITDLFISRGDTGFIGLFGYIGATGAVRRLNLSECARYAIRRHLPFHGRIGPSGGTVRGYDYSRQRNGRHYRWRRRN